MTGQESQPNDATVAKPNHPGFIVLLAGVVLPTITLGVELSTRMSSEAFFDPLPSLFHILLVALVPFANLLVWIALRQEDTSKKLAVLNGLAIGIALVYTLLFLPLVPIGAVAVIYFGLGLLPLAPMISLAAAVRLRMLLSRRARARQIRAPLWSGVMAGILVLLLLELPATVTRIGMGMASAESPETRIRGIQWLRAIGSEEQMLMQCYSRSHRADLLGSLITTKMTPQDAQTIYYRVTGTAFDAVPAPGRRGRTNDFFWRDNFDADLGGDRVGNKVQGLSLVSSRMDGSLDADAAVGYLEWTMVVRNQAPVAAEARAQIALPPDALVSRVTLWIDGEEREAAFAGRGQVKEAYKNVVRQNRDPVLVTSAGKNRIALQMFPVPPSGEMKVRLGITVPMRLLSEREGSLTLPYFHERNFELVPSLHHALWIDSKTSLHSDETTGVPIPNGFSLRTGLEDSQLARTDHPVIVEREPRNSAWAMDNKAAPGHLVRQHVVEQASRPPNRLLVVVDGSASMQAAAAPLAAALARLPDSVEPALIFASEATNEHLWGSGLTAPALADHLENHEYMGGQDNVAALARGLDMLAGQNDALLWIHGPQPLLLNTAEPLLQRLERRSIAHAWYEVQVQPGANLVGENLDGLISPMLLNREDLERLVTDWRSGTKRLVAQRERLPVANAGSNPWSEKTSDHLVRLWAGDEIDRVLQSPSASNRDEAVQLAQTYQLVTPVSGAVVLETKEQYDRAGLEPVGSGTVPTIPEPEVWALLVVVFLILTYAMARRRATSGGSRVAC